MIYRDRRDSGRQLAKRLTEFAGPDTIVLALPRGGVPVGYEVARQLNAPLDVFVVRKIGAPGHRELAIGAIAPEDTVVLNHNLMLSLGVDKQAAAEIIAGEREELERRLRLFRGNRPFPDLNGKTVILVDDGLATGSTALAAIRAIRQKQPKKLVLAVPVGATQTVDILQKEVDQLFCLSRPEQFFAVGAWYDDFAQTTDQEVTELLTQSRQETGASASAFSQPEGGTYDGRGEY